MACEGMVAPRVAPSCRVLRTWRQETTVSGILLQGMTEEKFKAELGSFRLWCTNSLGVCLCHFERLQLDRCSHVLSGEVFRDPFSLGGQRSCGLRPEDEDRLSLLGEASWPAGLQRGGSGHGS